MSWNADSKQTQLAQEKEARGPNRGSALRGSLRPHEAHMLPGQAGGPWRSCVAAHLSCVELRIRIWEARELSGTAIEVHIAGPKRGEEAQVVIHWKKQESIREVAMWTLLGFNLSTVRWDLISSPQFPPYAP